MLAPDTILEDFLTDPATGDPAIWRIINQMEGTTDLYPALVAQGVHHGVDDIGREGPVITLIVLRTNLEGKPYLKRQNVNPKSVFMRDQMVPELDGTAEAPKSLAQVVNEWRADRRDFLANLPSFGGTVVSGTLAEDAAAAAVE